METEMRSIVVTVCTGTACYILGGSDLLTLKDRLSPDHAGRVMLSASPCLNRCKDRAGGNRPPWVTVDGTLYAGLDLDGLVAVVERTLEAC